MSEPAPVALVTGGSRGLGRGICCQLAQGGFSVIINYAINVAAAGQASSLCEQVRKDDSQKFLPIQGDISSRDDRRNLLDRAMQEFGRIDVLVNNAGIAPSERADIIEAKEESFEMLIRTNLQGPYFLTQAVANIWLAGKFPPLLEDGFKIVFVTSISAYTASTNRGDYCISKAGLSMARKLWAVRLASENIQVIEIRPGIMTTDMTTGVKEKYDRLLGQGLVPQKRWGTPEDVGRAVRAAVSGALPFSTGTVIDVDGGFSLRKL